VSFIKREVEYTIEKGRNSSTQYRNTSHTPKMKKKVGDVFMESWY
jgi:hypothetical protein